MSGRVGDGRATVRIEHVALWTEDLERLRRFYEQFLGGRASALYHNERTGFESYFLEFGDGPRLELMRMPEIASRLGDGGRQVLGLVHIAFSLGAEAAVDELARTFAEAGYEVVDGPRRTGDGYYESVVLDPDGNRVELTV
jgi:lactoylglutathione lyase